MKSPAARHTFAVLVAFAAGATVGALFYTSKRVREKESVIAQLEQAHASYEARITELEASSHETIVYVEKPDGTRRTRIVRVKEEASRESAAAAAVGASREAVAAERSQDSETNRRSFGIHGGVRTDPGYFVGAQADLLGPIYFVGQVDLRRSDVAGAVGLGWRF